MNPVPRDEPAEISTQNVLLVGGDMMELINGNETAVKLFDAIFIDGEAEGRVRADQYFVRAFKEGADGLNLAPVSSMETSRSI